MSTGEDYDLAGIIEAYPEIANRFGPAFASTEIPKELSDFASSFNVFLIETQRLLTLEPRESLRINSSYRAGQARGHRQRPTVVEFSHDLTGRIGEALAAHSRFSSQLDRTFPRRILQGLTPDHPVSDEEIRERYDSQTRLRSQLADISVLDQTHDFPLPDRELKDWERDVLWAYLDDADKKLATFKPLLERLSLFRDIVNSRFQYKTLRIDPERGFRVVTDDGLELKPSQLSSGEQHELVLAYALLFSVDPGSLVLIDEPEISLHVSWQQSFLEDIRRVASIADLRFIVATHSPQIVYKSSNFMTELTSGE